MKAFCFVHGSHARLVVAPTEEAARAAFLQMTDYAPTVQPQCVPVPLTDIHDADRTIRASYAES